MPAQVIVARMRDKIPTGIVVNTTSKSESSWERDLSPFHLGPCKLDGDENRPSHSLRHENAWQFSKVYKQHTDENGDPTQEYHNWAYEGYLDSYAHRFPMGRGARPEYSLWNGEKLGYIDARKQIYAPLYVRAVLQTEGWKFLQWLYKKADVLVLRDFDGYQHEKEGLTLTEVLNRPDKIMGHAFVLAMMLKKDPALKQLHLKD